MNQSDVFYRAFLNYREQIDKSRECTIERKAVSLACAESDVINVIKTICTVEEDWIEAIEKGLVHIGKAIDENRQFILSRGEVIPIEKVKRVSKDSVEHLARHSELISKKPKDDRQDLIPEKLYTVERLNDFAVYENRFLFMLLCYLKSFISFRYEKIVELTSTYQGGITINKIVTMFKRKMSFELKMKDVRYDDEYLKAHNALKKIIDRVDDMLQTVIFYLETPLMQEVAKVPMIKTPITKTNVLKMNENFSGAVDLFDYVTAYEKLGYSAEEKKERISPFPHQASNEFSEAIMLTSFLTYKHALDQEALLRKTYDEEEARRKEAEESKIREELAQLKRKITEAGGDSTEYMHLLEKRNKSLELDRTRLVSARQEILKLRTETDELKSNVKQLSTKINEKRLEIENMLFEHKKFVAELKAQQLEEIAATTERIYQEVKADLDSKDNTISALEKSIGLQRTAYEKRIAEMQTEAHNEIDGLKSLYNSRIDELEKSLEKLSGDHSKLTEDKALVDARLYAMRKEHNLITADENFTSKAAFDELEHQYTIFTDFMRGEWRKAKKRIRKDVFKLRNDVTEEKKEGENKSAN